MCNKWSLRAWDISQPDLTKTLVRVSASVSVRVSEVPVSSRCPCQSARAPGWATDRLRLTEEQTQGYLLTLIYPTAVLRLQLHQRQLAYPVSNYYGQPIPTNLYCANVVPRLMLPSELWRGSQSLSRFWMKVTLGACITSQYITLH